MFSLANSKFLTSAPTNSCFLRWTIAAVRLTCRRRGHAGRLLPLATELVRRGTLLSQGGTNPVSPFADMWRAHQDERYPLVHRRRRHQTVFLVGDHRLVVMDPRLQSPFVSHPIEGRNIFRPAGFMNVLGTLRVLRPERCLVRIYSPFSLAREIS